MTPPPPLRSFSENSSFLASTGVPEGGLCHISYLIQIFWQPLQIGAVNIKALSKRESPTGAVFVFTKRGIQAYKVFPYV